MSLYLPNPCLQGILLTISTHTGPQLVFHYPPKPNEYGYQATPFTIDRDLVNQDSESDDTDDSVSDNDEELDKRSKSKTNRYISGQTLLDLLDEQDKKREEKEKKILRSKQSKKTSVSSLTARLNTTSIHTNDNVHHQDDALRKVFGFDPEFLADILNPPKQLCNTKFEFSVDDMVFLGLPIHVNENGAWRTHKQRKDTKSRRSTNASTVNSGKEDNTEISDNDGDDEKEDELQEGDTTLKLEDNDTESIEENSMTMFNVVFVMNPPIVEYNYRVDEMFHFVVSRLSLVLRYEQDKSGYIWNESRKILKIKEDNNNLPLFELYSKITSESTLAKTVEECFNSISTSEVANLVINDKLISLQIPLKNQFKSLLPKTTPVLAGSYLSSTIIEGNGSYEEEENMGHMALLLLEEPEKIIADLKGEQNGPLSTFIRSIHPMMSLSKLAAANQLELSQLTSFTKHLVYWRKARAILPLHPKSVFIVSPMAPLKNIQQDSKTFKQNFQALPSLPSFLSLISNSKPRQYSIIIPSRDHRDTYMDALAWLIKYGYVTQLLTFVWIKIQNRIKIAVDEDLEKEGITRKDRTRMKKYTDLSTDNSSKANDVKSKRVDSFSNVTLNINGTEVIVIEEDEEDTILLDPESATAVERRWIGKVIRGQPAEMVAIFHKVMKYFNGKTPIELIIVKENVSRTELKRLLHCIGDNIISVKHW